MLLLSNILINLCKYTTTEKQSTSKSAPNSLIVSKFIFQFLMFGSHTIPALDTELAVPPSQPVPFSSLGQMPAKAFLPDLPGLASFSFSPVPNYSCAAFHTNTANASELCGLRKFRYYIPRVVCQDVKMLSK